MNSKGNGNMTKWDLEKYRKKQTLSPYLLSCSLPFLLFPFCLHWSVLKTNTGVLILLSVLGIDFRPCGVAVCVVLFVHVLICVCVSLSCFHQYLCILRVLVVLRVSYSPVLQMSNVPSALFVALVSDPHVLWVSVFVSRRFIKELKRVVCVCVVVYSICKPIPAQWGDISAQVLIWSSRFQGHCDVSVCVIIAGIVCCF